MKKRQAQANGFSTRASKRATASAGQSDGLFIRRKVAVKPDNDNRFAELEPAECEPCYWYETNREPVGGRRARLVKEIADIDNGPESDAEKSKYKRHLLAELAELKRDERPWWELSDAEKRAYASNPGGDPGGVPDDPKLAGLHEPVRRADEVTDFERALRKASFDTGVLEDVRLTLNFAYSKEPLMASFGRLVKKMLDQGKDKFTVSRRGRPKYFQLRLFGLSVYRCLRRGMTPEQVWDHLAPLRTKFSIGEHRRTKLQQLADEIEQDIC